MRDGACMWQQAEAQAAEAAELADIVAPPPAGPRYIDELPAADQAEFLAWCVGQPEAWRPETLPTSGRLAREPSFFPSRRAA